MKSIKLVSLTAALLAGYLLPSAADADLPIHQEAYDPTLGCVPVPDNCFWITEDSNGDPCTVAAWWAPLRYIDETSPDDLCAEGEIHLVRNGQPKEQISNYP